MKRCLGCSRAFESIDWICPHCQFSGRIVDGYPTFAPELANEYSGFQPEYFQELAELESSNFWFRARNRLIIWALRRHFSNARNFLEIGCGTGFVLSGIADAVPKIRLSGSEIFLSGLCFASSRLPDAEFFQMDARRVPFEDEFDVIGAFDVLEHISEDEMVLSQMYQATTTGGGIILTVPQHAFLWSPQDEYARHVRRYEAEDLKEKVRRAGFIVERTTSFVSLLLPLMFLSRLRKRKSGEQLDALDELRIGGLANAVLEATLDIERVFIHLGCSLPMGGSLLLIARKYGGRSGNPVQ
jgi:SAM-dependent methyltransferase